MVSVFVLDRELSLGERVRITRLVKGWRQIDVAAVARCSPSDVSLLERGIPISDGVKARIFNALGITEG
jgi:transcriptional regulator with XRE-family HTH domain